MKKIITFIVLVLSLVTTPVSAKSYTDAEIDSIFANTLAFQHRLDTAVYTYVGIAKRYKDAITCYNLIKQHKMNKKDISAVLKDISENYEPSFAEILNDTNKTIRYHEPIYKKHYTIEDSYTVDIDGVSHTVVIKTPHYNRIDHNEPDPWSWYNLYAVRADGTKFLSQQMLLCRHTLYGF